MIVSEEALAALAGLEHGAQYNIMHSTARELMDAGLACNDWGHLGMTEAGRLYLRRGARNIPINNDDDQVYDMSVHMMQVPKAPIDRRPSKFWKNNTAEYRGRGDFDPTVALDTTAVATRPLELVEEEPAAPLPIAETRRQAMMRAAGEASGATGIWPDEAWVIAFIDALDKGGADGVFLK
jgi:hypothetical protein